MTTWVDVRRTVAAAIIVHGVIHLLGAMTAWRLSPFNDPPYSTLILAARIDAGDTGQLVMGAAWLFAALVLVGAAAAIWRSGDHVLLVIAAAFAVSLAVGLAGLPASRLGVVIDVAVLIAVAMTRLWGPLAHVVHQLAAARPQRSTRGGRL
jgi:hypothetical protein